MGQTFYSLKYGHCQDSTCAPMPMQMMYYSCLSQLQEKHPVPPVDPSVEKWPLLVLARNTMKLQHFIIHFSLQYLSSGRLREVKKKAEKFQTFSSYDDVFSIYHSSFPGTMPLQE